MEEQLVRFIAESLVEKPEAVQVRRKDLRDAVKVTLRVAPEDMGRVIGKQGRIANAVRTLLRVVSREKNVLLEID
ncbi:MAG: KH domain-containing protein [Anaerolineae bacterium]|jgi:hypothetical protein|nr:KH domain-containing protein [Anaerolineae bacterium]